MDFLRTSSIPALIAALLACAALPAAALCAAPGATFAAESKDVDGKMARISTYVTGDSPKDKDALIRVDKPGSGASFGGEGMITRGKVTHLPATATFTRMEGTPRIAFHDAAGKRLAELPMYEGWTCEGDALRRSGERYSGIGDDIRTVQVDETMTLGPAGELVYRRTTIEIEPKRGNPQTVEFRFPAATSR